MKRFLKMAALAMLTGGLLLAGGNLYAADTKVAANAQQDQVCRGVVLDTQGLGVIGASVLIKGQPVAFGTVTDFDGNFVQKNARPGDVLVISCIGYVTQEVVYDGKPVNVVLAEESEMLTETVVTAYGGRQLRSKLTNSIATVKEDVLTAGMHAQVAQALSGAVSGLRVQQTSGNPGANPTIVLRGGTQLGGSGSPLVIVDGAQRSLSDLNPNDIESMEVLKDAGATAIYGARAANGVILITTKRGKAGHSAINARVKFSANFEQHPYEFLNSEDYLYHMRMAYKRSSEFITLSDGTKMGSTNLSSLTGTQPYGTGNLYWDDDGNVLDGRVNGRALWGVFDNSTGRYSSLLGNSNWAEMTDPVTGNKLVFWNGATVADINIKSPAFSQDYNVDFQGGNDKGSYYASLGYNHSEGNALDNEYNRLTFAFNGDYKVRDWLTSSSSLNFAHTIWTPIKNGNTEAYYFNRSWSVPPTYRTTNADGEWNPSPRNNIHDGHVAISNPQRIYDYNTDKFNMNQSFTVFFSPSLNFKASASWYYEDNKQEYFMKDYLVGANRMYNSRESYAYYNRNLNETYNGILNYNRTFAGAHSIAVMLGTEFLNQSTKGFDAYGRGADTDEFQDLALTQVGDTRSIDSWHSQSRVLSFFAKADYDYDAKYLLSLVARYDGYSRLARQSRWGFFPGVSAGWVFSKENFMRPLNDVISFAKLRASFGANGSLDQIGPYTVFGAYGNTTKYMSNNAILFSTLPSPALLWEKSWTLETGLDISFWENRLNLNLTYYNRHTLDKIANITIPSHTGASSLRSNNGELQNQGVEFDINWRAVNTRDWRVNFTLIGAYNRNKIIKLPDNGLENNRQNAIQVYDPATGKLIWVGGYQEGQTPGDIYGPLAEGIYTSYSEIPGNLIDKTSGNNGSNGKWLYGPDAWAQLSDAEKRTAFPIQPGDVKWKDVNGDGVIDNYDLVKLGNAMPKWTGGFTTNIAWKGLSLTGRFDYALDYKVVDNSTPWIMGNMQGTFNTISLVKDSYNIETGQAGRWPSYVWADQLGKRNYARSNNSLFVYEGSYLAVREIQLAYDLPNTLLDKVSIKRLQFYVSGQNLGYLTKAGLLGTPEYGASSWGSYRLPRTVIFGINLTF